MPTQSTQGHLALDFRYIDTEAKTVMQVTAQAHPLRVVRAFTHPDSSASVHLHNVSGGVLGGDSLSLSVHVQPNARAQLTTPGATRIYRQRASLPDSVQKTMIHIESGGRLEYLPESIIPFAQARYRQQTEIHLADDAGLFWWEIVAPGRVAHQEVFAYDQLEMKTTIMARQIPIALERLRFSPDQNQSSSLVRLGEYTYWTTFYACRVGIAAKKWRDLESDLALLAQQLSVQGRQSWGVSTLVSDGVVIRGLGTNSENLTQGLTRFWQASKQSLYQAVAYLPRKLY